MRFRYCICLLLLLSKTLTAQQHYTWKGLGIEANFMGGKVFKHTENFHAPVPDFSSAFELNFVQQTYGKNDWEQRRNYPLVGVGLTFTNYGIDSIYGKCISIYPNLQLPIIKGKNIEWTLRAGFGLGYVTRHYERAPVFDTLNNAIGSHFNNYSFFAMDIRLRLNTHIDLQLGANFSHISNAALRTPNLGVNLYGAHLGLRYFPVTSKPEKNHRKLTPLRNRWLAQIRLGIAANEYGQANGPLYPIYLVSVFASKRYLSKNKLLMGIDYSYHEGIYAFLKNNEIHPGEESKYSWKSSIFLGNEFLLGRFGILLQVGYYIKEASLKLDPYYEKLGCNIYLIQQEKGLLKELSISALLKTHKTQAELVEIGIGAGF